MKTDYESTPQPETAQAFINTLNIPYSTHYVPLSQSRNANEKELSLNWLINFGGLTTDYMQGIAHMPEYDFNNKTVVYHNRLRLAVERGMKCRPEYPNAILGKLPEPKLIDVLHSLVMDSDVIEHDSFTDWAECFGYDSDSIKARGIYDACLSIALKLRQLIDLDAAHKAFQGY